MTRASWKANCDRCDGTYMSHQLRHEWTGLRTCHGSGTRNCWEPRSPQEGRAVPPDRQTVPWVRPEPDPVWAEDLPSLTQDDL